MPVYIITCTTSKPPLIITAYSTLAAATKHVDGLEGYNGYVIVKAEVGTWADADKFVKKVNAERKALADAKAEIQQKKDVKDIRKTINGLEQKIAEMQKEVDQNIVKASSLMGGSDWVNESDSSDSSDSDDSSDESDTRYRPRYGYDGIKHIEERFK